MVSKPIKLPDSLRLGDDFELDVRAYELRSAGIPLKLKPIPMELLLLLVERRGELVTREQIVERIWGKGVFLDTDNSINGAISRIRQVLRDDVEEPRFVQTVTGKGYRFIAPVVEGDRTDPQSPGLDPSTGPESLVQGRAEQTGGEIAPGALHRRWWAIGLGALLVIIASLGVWRHWSRTRVRPPQGKVMLAVLPFDNLTGDPAQEYFSDGITEEMINRVGGLDPQHLGVIARTSVMRYKNTRTPLDQIGRELGVQYVIEGAVRQDSHHVRVTAQLIQTKDQTPIWAQQYDRELKGLLALQTEIAREVANEIQLSLGDHKPAPDEPVLSRQEYEAYDLYLRGQYFFNKRDGPSLEEAIGYFEQAIEKDPTNARAYAALADCYALIPGYNSRPGDEFISRARAAAMKAVKLDENLPEAHTALALIVQNYDWDWPTAEKEFRRAIELNPNYATAHHWYAEHLMWRGRFDEALQESERARQLDPLSLIIAADNGAILYFSRQYDRAIEKWRSVLEVDPEFSRAHLIHAAYVDKGMFAEALADVEKQPHKPEVAWYWGWIAYIRGRSGRKAEARHALKELLQLNRRDPVNPQVIALASIGVGDKDQALTWLEKAAEQHSNELTSLKVNPAYDSLRGEPRFQELLRRVGLAD
ncbi:MAG: winged helix-turn-helix domain-containing protein [Acidobacteriia bacterium]|nr:winged helix-turn-helix domain-containing protein [Terriglobia bacterium]